MVHSRMFSVTEVHATPLDYPVSLFWKCLPIQPLSGFAKFMVVAELGSGTDNRKTPVSLLLMRVATK